MICYRDMTFCSQSDCMNRECGRNPQTAYNELSEIDEDKRLPLALADLKDTDYCLGYITLGAIVGILKL